MIEEKRVTHLILKQNGNTSSKGMVIELSDTAITLESFKEILHENYGINQCNSFTFFNQSGIEIVDDTFILIKDGETVYYEMVQGKTFDFNNILSQYEVLEKLGKGGFGSVYRAKHKDSNKIVAIKYIDITENSNLEFNF